MKNRTPFDDLSRALAAGRDPLAQAIGPDPVRTLRDQAAAPFDAIATVLATRNPTVDAALGIASGSDAGKALSDAARGYMPGQRALDAALGFTAGDAVLEAARGNDRDRLRAGLDRAADAFLHDTAPYRSPARDILDRMGTHPDVKPAHRGHARLAPADAVPVASVADIGRRIRAYRRGMGLTQQRFADMAGVGRRFLIELEQGKATLEIGKVLAVCRAAGIGLSFAS
jgi:y4mF family transcriptional regulator